MTTSASYARVLRQFKAKQNPIILVDGVFYALGKKVLAASFETAR